MSYYLVSSILYSVVIRNLPCHNHNLVGQNEVLCAFTFYFNNSSMLPASLFSKCCSKYQCFNSKWNFQSWRDRLGFHIQFISITKGFSYPVCSRTRLVQCLFSFYNNSLLPKHQNHCLETQTIFTLGWVIVSFIWQVVVINDIGGLQVMMLMIMMPMMVMMISSRHPWLPCPSSSVPMLLLKLSSGFTVASNMFFVNIKRFIHPGLCLTLWDLWHQDFSSPCSCLALRIR